MNRLTIFKYSWNLLKTNTRAVGTIPELRYSYIGLIYFCTKCIVASTEFIESKFAKRSKMCFTKHNLSFSKTFATMENQAQKQSTPVQGQVRSNLSAQQPGPSSAAIIPAMYKFNQSSSSSRKIIGLL